jgi:type IV secretory pathway VirB4 component
MGRLGTEMLPLKANERVRILCDIFRGVDTDLSFITRDEFARCAEKTLCCPEYFEFKKNYFMYDDKFARCLYFMKLPTATVSDNIFKEIIELNLTLILSKNVNFVETVDAIEMLRQQLTSIKAEEIQKTRSAAEKSRGAFVDPIEGTELAENKAQAYELLEDLQGRNQKMTLCQFIVMLTADSHEELEQHTETLKILMRKHQITLGDAAFRQEQALASVLPLGNSNSIDKENNLQVRRTLSSESTAVFCPFNSKELVHENGIYYGVNQLTRAIILFNRRNLSNPNGFIFGVPGAGKGVTAKIEMIYNILSSNDEILILDPEREYTMLAKLFGGEVIYISETSATHINPLDLTENPDPADTSYDPITAKLEFLLSFFAAILGVNEIDPLQKNIIDIVMRETYTNNPGETPTLKEYYTELEKYEKENIGDAAKKAAYLRQALHLYVHGSMNVFSHKSNVNINSRIVVYDIKDLGKNMQTLGMMIVLENLWDRVALNRSKGIGTRIYIDEMYLMFKSEQCANFFYELWKRARKWGGIPTGITQNVDDLLMSKKAETMLANTKFVLMLSQNPTDAEKLSQILKIPMETMSYVINSGVGRGLLYAGEYGNIPFDNRFPTNTSLWKVITTAFAENLDETELKENDEELQKV